MAPVFDESLPRLAGAEWLVRPELEGSGCLYLPNFLNEEEAKAAFEHCRALPEFKLLEDDYGVQERLTLYMGDSDTRFAYVGLKLDPSEWDVEVDKVRHMLNDTMQLGITSCMLNNYLEGEGRIPEHFDEVRAHGEHKVIVSVTLGGARPFRIRHRDTDARKEVLTAPGSALIMFGNMQETHMHELPLIEGQCPHRIALTFRSIVPGWERLNAPQDEVMRACVEKDAIPEAQRTKLRAAGLEG